jgi:predicted aldo/keto reductase-like oxidoreductase
MRTTLLGKSGLEVSAVGFGGIPIMRLTEADAVNVIHRALDLGVTFIDTASGYGDSQAKIGAAIHDRRDGLVIATKSPARDAAGMAADIETARRDMRTDVIDLVQLHAIGSDEEWRTVRSPGGAMEALLAAKDAGHVRHIGYTSHDLATALMLAAEDVFETVQFPFNLVAREPGEKLLPVARDNGLGFIVMKPMCGGQFDDAELAFKYLNAYPDLVAIPGIETAAEIEQIVAVVESAATLTGDDKARAEKIVGRLGKLFCRRCGYCQPCPEGIGITSALILDGLLKRFPTDLAVNCAKGVAEKVPACTECGQCEDKCPYDLPIRDLIKEAGQVAERFLAERETP